MKEINCSCKNALRRCVVTLTAGTWQERSWLKLEQKKGKGELQTLLTSPDPTSDEGNSFKEWKHIYARDASRDPTPSGDIGFQDILLDR